MALECPKTKSSLHQWGKINISYLSTQPLLYRTAQGATTEPVIPSPDIFDFDRDNSHPSGFDGQRLTINSTNESRLPSVSECAAHLELLEVFYVLRQNILSSQAIDDAMDITPNREEKTGRFGDTKIFKDTTLWEKRQVKWPKFLDFAAVRFLTWMDLLVKRHDEYISTDQNGRASLIHLPPLDVIMVWHSFMLNPRLFNETCRDHPIYKLRMPWRTIHRAIENKDWGFKEDREAATLFETCAGVSSDLFQQLSSWSTAANDSAAGYTPKLTAFVLEGVDIHARRSALSKMSSKYLSMLKEVDLQLAVKLRDAVIRQAEFVDKMNNHLWIRSPALEGTMRRAIDRYDKFLILLKMQSKITIVPTLDIDIVWHTHQCAPALYANGMKAMVGRFINHDDTIVKEELGDGFEFSRNMYRIRFGKEYRICGCWDCEALLSAVEEMVQKDESEANMAEIARETEKKVMYYRAVEVAIRNKQPLPVLD